jgi:hypothetical protein
VSPTQLKVSLESLAEKDRQPVTLLVGSRIHPWGHVVDFFESGFYDIV